MSAYIRLCKPFIGKPKLELTPAFKRLSGDKQKELMNAWLMDLSDLRREVDWRARAKFVADDAKAAAQIRVKA